MSPLKVLTRGYAFVQDDSDRILRSTKEVAPGDKLTVTLRDGTVTAVAQQIKENSQ